MPTKLKDTLEKVRKRDNKSNSELLIEFYEYMRTARTSERYQSDVLKVLVKFSEFIDDNIMNIQKKEQVIAFLNTKIKNKEEDPDEKWITTWNDYLWRIKYFYRWLYNIKKNENIDNFISSQPSNWTTPIFVQIKKIKTKRLSPYLESELWEKEEIISIIKYEPYSPDFALKKKVRWSINSKQGARYIKRRIGEELKMEILARNGIISEQESKQKPSVHLCSRCELVNAIDNKYCSKCSYPLTPQAFEEIKTEEDKRMRMLEEKQKEKESEIQTMKQQIAMLIESQKEIIKCLKYPNKLLMISKG